MLDFDHFVRAGKDDIVFAHDGAAAHGVQTDLMFIALFAYRMAVIDVLGRVRNRIGNRVGDGKRRWVRPAFDCGAFR